MLVFSDITPYPPLLTADLKANEASTSYAIYLTGEAVTCPATTDVTSAEQVQLLSIRPPRQHHRHVLTVPSPHFRP